MILFILILASLSFSDNMVNIPGGSFVRGGAGGGADELPAQRVTISPFRMDKREVTNREYEECVRRRRCTPAGYADSSCFYWGGTRPQRVVVRNSEFLSPDRPVTCVTWAQAAAYCRAQGKRLPTEAEWEFAATYGGRLEYSIGELSEDRAIYNRSNPYDVGGCPAGAYGLYDMVGNVWEWTADRYAKNAYEISDTLNPKGSTVGQLRVIRGGGWYSPSSQLRGRARLAFMPTIGEVSVGFRCVAD